jgi:hypothetical protein
MDNLHHRAAQLIARLRRGEPLNLDAQTFFGEIVEPLCDAFEPACCDLYADLMTALLGDDSLRARYERIRHPRPWTGADPDLVVVLSRVTLGADVVVTSTVLSAIERRFPRARLALLGSRKSWELFASGSRIELIEAPYARAGSVGERLRASFAVARLIPPGNVLVVDPDSRLSQLGIVPVCDEERYRFFESRSWGGDTPQPLAALTAAWLLEVFGVSGAPWVAPPPSPETGFITVSLGVGDNPRKQGDPQFERRVMEGLVARGLPVLVDYGASDAEARRVEHAIAGLPVQTWRGAFAPFAARIVTSRLYFGYDSAGQHVAAAAGVPLVSVFKGYATERTFQRWQPFGPAPKVILRTASATAVLNAVDQLLG